MKILYAALDQRVPGTVGGSVHVRAVAEGLAALGHEVHVLAVPGDGGFPEGPVHWRALAPPLGARALRLARTGRVRDIARRIRPDVILERYYNFGGEGLLAARKTGALAVLEINAPVIDHPGSAKRVIDRALILQPMRRWREWQCRAAGLLVTPTAAIIPAEVPRDRIVEIEWGADTERFRPDARGAVPFARRPGEVLAVFAGAFRAWHGAHHLVDAIARLHARGRRMVGAILIGDGPELGRVRAAARGIDGIRFTGAISHDALPAALAAADIGVAPFDVAAHPPLSLGFYWSPLKVFEYMAAGLAIAAPAIDRLATIVRHEQEALLYDPGDANGLADALERLLDPERRAALGRAARARVVERYSWAAHCARLADTMSAALARRQPTRCAS